ncbi:Alpha/Beta hydrolase protein [Hyaloscypha sp. PMI_1271]|nr:Alpha/Beta hydrolase protein [Hyaloscypha sp. PMI_1271]
MANIGMREVLFEGTNPTNVDIVFVHGLNGDRLATWTKDKICWPRDLLKDDIPSSRIMSWGYDANVMNFLDVAGQSSVAALALQLLEDLARRRRTAEEMQRPIIFVVHSLGGLVVKDALTQSYNESRAERVLKPKIASIKSKTLGVIFAGTPHRGADKAKWGKIATNIATIVLKDNNSALVGALCRGSETLERLQNDFARVIDSLRIYTFFEDYRYPKIGKIVDNDSASLAAAHEHKQVLPGNHSDMIKFSRKDDSGYERVSGAILDILEAGPMESQRQGA